MSICPIVMFGKAPVPGKVKTRLAKGIGAESAAALYAAFLLDQAERLVAPREHGRLSAAGDLDHPVFEQVEKMGVDVVRQAGDGLGDRIATAADEAFAAGGDRVVIVGSDSPTLPSSYIDDALALLEDDTDVAMGPSFDGGFTLIASRVDLHPLRGNIAWSSQTTLAETVGALRRAGHVVRHLGFWYDVDEPDDLTWLAGHLLGWQDDDASAVAPRTARWLVEHGFRSTRAEADG